MRFNRVSFCLLCAMVFLGCINPRISTLTPETLPRNSSNLYPVEIVWESNSGTVKSETVKPVVWVGSNTYPMEKLLAEDGKWVKNRWHTLIPVDPQQNEVSYLVKVDWKQSAISAAPGNSLRTEKRLLRIKD